jgi:excisionase family DNA binding protein
MSALEEAARELAELSRRLGHLESQFRALPAGQDGQPARVAYRPREVAEMTGLSYDVVLELIHAGELQAITVGRLHVVPAASITALLARTGDVVRLGEL